MLFTSKNYKVRLKSESTKNALIKIAKANEIKVCNNYESRTASEWPFLGLKFEDGYPWVFGSKFAAGAEVITLEEMIDMIEKGMPCEVKLNEEYTAVVMEDHVQVGCQRIEFDSVRKLYEAIQKK